ncbi:hypothetical protein HYH03_004664 [Edaphochlamys debaryana]|nr:hypothetical protein HYH03_004664 [Edaphochlamys debaryana]|eukprot:KAG2497514.1 hypothetical protein HYH03_004664 [Edaphochlamys debaryana]
MDTAGVVDAEAAAAAPSHAGGEPKRCAVTPSTASAAGPPTDSADAHAGIATGPSIDIAAAAACTAEASDAAGAPIGNVADPSSTAAAADAVPEEACDGALHPGSHLAVLLQTLVTSARAARGQAAAVAAASEAAMTTLPPAEAAALASLLGDTSQAVADFAAAAAAGADALSAVRNRWLAEVAAAPPPLQGGGGEVEVCMEEAVGGEGGQEPPSEEGRPSAEAAGGEGAEASACPQPSGGSELERAAAGKGAGEAGRVQEAEGGGEGRAKADGEAGGDYGGGCGLRDEGGAPKLRLRSKLDDPRSSNANGHCQPPTMVLRWTVAWSSVRPEKPYEAGVVVEPYEPRPTPGTDKRSDPTARRPATQGGRPGTSAAAGRGCRPSPGPAAGQARASLDTLPGRAGATRGVQSPGPSRLSALAQRRPGAAANAAGRASCDRPSLAASPIRGSLAGTPSRGPTAPVSAKELYEGPDQELAERLKRHLVDLDVNVRWDDVVGLEKAKNELALLTMPMPNFAAKGVLLCGPPGTGKTMLAKAFATDTACTLLNASSASLDKCQGDHDVEDVMRVLFKLARELAPVTIFMDIDKLCSQAGGANEHEAARRFTKALLKQIGKAKDPAKDAGGGEAGPSAPKHVFVLAATNRPWEVDESLRSRLEYVYTPLPDHAQRLQLLMINLKYEVVAPDVDLESVAGQLEGCSGGDIGEVCRAAAMKGLRRVTPAEILAMRQAGKDFMAPVTFEDFAKAIQKMREELSVRRVAEAAAAPQPLQGAGGEVEVGMVEAAGGEGGQEPPSAEGGPSAEGAGGEAAEALMRPLPNGGQAVGSGKDGLELERAAAGDGDGAGQAEAEDGAEGEAGGDYGAGYDLLDEDVAPKLVTQFKLCQKTVAVFEARTREDFEDVTSLLKEEPLHHMVYLLARAEVDPHLDMAAALRSMAAGEASMEQAVGRAVSCISASFGTNKTATEVFDFEDPEALRYYGVRERMEMCFMPLPAEAADKGPSDYMRDMYVGLLYALCKHATENGIRCGFCAAQPEALKVWQEAGVKMEQIDTGLRVRYPQTHDKHDFYSARTVAWFQVEELMAGLEHMLSIVA